MRNARGGRRGLSPWLLALAAASLLAACDREPTGLKRQGSSNEGKAAQSAAGGSANEGKAIGSAGR
jgi:hypothetical protein